MRTCRCLPTNRERGCLCDVGGDAHSAGAGSPGAKPKACAAASGRAGQPPCTPLRNSSAGTSAQPELGGPQGTTHGNRALGASPEQTGGREGSQVRRAVAQRVQESDGTDAGGVCAARSPQPRAWWRTEGRGSAGWDGRRGVAGPALRVPSEGRR